MKPNERVPIPSLYIILYKALLNETNRTRILPTQKARLALSRSVLGLSSVRATIILAEMEAYGLILKNGDKAILLEDIKAMGLPFL